MTRAILTDIEGTTSSISFVKDVLFPYASRHLPSFVAQHAGEQRVRSLLDEVCDIVGQQLSEEAIIAQLLCWIDEDRKIGPLKAMQGMIWESGYRNGDFYGHVYADAVRALRSWKEQGLRIFVYSSGSVYAQTLLFGHTEYGDLTPLFDGYFDTGVGAKREVSSYQKISEQIGMPANEILFLSDIEEELDAARVVGMSTCQLIRAGTDTSHKHAVATTFSEIVLAS